jgi:excisionase family DNA binding protein
MGNHSVARMPKTAERREPEYLAIGEVAQTLRLSTATVYRMAKNGSLPIVRFGRGAIRVPASALEPERKS